MEPNTPTTKWQVIIKFSLIYALALIGLMLVFFILDMPIKDNWVMNILNIVIVAGAIFYGLKSTRDETLNGFMSYGEGLGAGCFIVLFATIILTAYNYLHMTVIDPDMMNRVIEEAQRKMIEKGDSEENIDMAMQYIKKFSTPGIASIFAFIFQFLFGFVITLIVAIFTKKDNPDKLYNSLQN